MGRGYQGDKHNSMWINGVRRTRFAWTPNRAMTKVVQGAVNVLATRDSSHVDFPVSGV